MVVWREIAVPTYLSMHTLFSSLLSPLSPLHLSPPPPRLDIKVVGRRPPPS